jgi:uncharacterized membrane protein
VIGCHHRSKVGTVSLSYWFWICWQPYKYKVIWAELWKTEELITFYSLMFQTFALLLKAKNCPEISVDIYQLHDVTPRLTPAFIPFHIKLSKIITPCRSAWDFMEI